MIQLHTTVTDSGMPPLILLEELGLPDTLDRPNPTGKLPGPSGVLPWDTARSDPFIYDESNSLLLHESGAILLYLSEKTRRLLPIAPKARALAYQWLFSPAPFAHGSQDPGTNRAYLVVQNAALVTRDYLAGDFSLAGIATYPFVWRCAQNLTLDPGLALESWLVRMSERPAVTTAHVRMVNP